MRCSAERPCRPKTSRSPRTTRTCLSGVTRPSADEPPPSSRSPVWHGSSRASSTSVTPSAKREDTSSGVAATSAVPVQPVVVTSWPWYSSAGRPTDAALTRSGMSLVTRVTGVGLGREVERAGEDPGVVLRRAEPGRQHRRVGVVELDPQRPALRRHGDRLVETAVTDAEVVEQTQCLPREPAQLGVVALALELGDDDEREDHLVLGEPRGGPRVREEHGGVEDVTARAVGGPGGTGDGGAGGGAGGAHGSGTLGWCCAHDDSLERPRHPRPLCSSAERVG